jgi:hypothetical protein
MRFLEGQYERPDILFVMSDDHAAHANSAYGSRVARKLNIDRLPRSEFGWTVGTLPTPSGQQDWKDMSHANINSFTKLPK